MAADPVSVDYDDFNNQVNIAVSRAPTANETKQEQRMPCPKCSVMVSNRVINLELKKAWFVSRKECPQCSAALRMYVLPFRNSASSRATDKPEEFYGWMWVLAEMKGLTSNPS